MGRGHCGHCGQRGPSGIDGPRIDVFPLVWSVAGLYRASHKRSWSLGLVVLTKHSTYLTRGSVPPRTWSGRVEGRMSTPFDRSGGRIAPRVFGCPRCRGACRRHHAGSLLFPRHFSTTIRVFLSTGVRRAAKGGGPFYGALHATTQDSTPVLTPKLQHEDGFSADAKTGKGPGRSAGHAGRPGQAAATASASGVGINQLPSGRPQSPTVLRTVGRPFQVPRWSRGSRRSRSYPGTAGFRNALRAQPSRMDTSLTLLPAVPPLHAMV